ncbi:MAG: SGNH/GDSL hydrolase family protein [Acidobacteriota bacterium]
MGRGRLTQSYQTVAVVFLNTLLLTGAVLVALHIAFPLERSIWNQNLGGSRLSEAFVPEHYYLTGTEETRRIRQTWDDYVLDGHWQAHPWTGLINRPFSSEYLNIAEDGGRGGPAPSAEHADQPPLVLWTFGGSTLFGWGVADAYTVPAQLQSALQARRPDRQVRVMNFGVPWYNSTHEVTLLTAHLRNDPTPPDAVVFLDGLNDLVHRVHYRSESPLFPQLRGAWEGRLNDLFAPPPWLRLKPSFPLFRAALELGEPPPSTTLGGIVDPTQVADEAALVRQAADNYRLNRRLTRSICGELGIVPFFLLQPVPMWLDEARARNRDPRYERFAEQVLAGEDEAPDVADLRGALAPLEPRYAMSVEPDGAHYSDIAGRVLATAIADLIADRWPEDQ